METILFVCKANVGRSQIAEWLYNNQNYNTSIAISIAWSEARKEKYNGQPAEEIVSFLKNYRWIDISHQSIKYVTDINQWVLAHISKIIFLYDPVENKECDDACKIAKDTPYEYFKNRWFCIQINPVPDPYETWKRWYQGITNRIQEIIAKL